MSQRKQVVLVTGGNRGIGLEAVKQLSEKYGDNAVILMSTRTIENGNKAIERLRQSNNTHSYSNITPLQLDVTQKDSIKAAVEHVKKEFQHLDVLINNSGIATLNTAEVLAVNYYGVKEMINSFAPVLIPQHSKILVVSSEVGSWYTNLIASPALQEKFTNLTSRTEEEIDELATDYLKETATQPWPKRDTPYSPYSVSKALLTAYVRIYARDHPEFKVVVVCPGYCATELNHFSGPRSAVVGGASVIWPVFNHFEQGSFYQDGQQHAFSSPGPEFFRNVFV
eukprot:TRINITY_DN5214_c0_g1_i1.p1 TRINITY_DN5214_c0_g1~~TRINITY_DN5214_c0_g1_i1.p1  ORF type:complete len:292 (+),score=70.66 TRINITY_DN5214_c0_g1_i1:32-877(+)